MPPILVSWWHQANKTSSARWVAGEIRIEVCRIKDAQVRVGGASVYEVLIYKHFKVFQLISGISGYFFSNLFLISNKICLT
jgi:hypothetical protein